MHRLLCAFWARNREQILFVLVIERTEMGSEFNSNLFSRCVDCSFRGFPECNANWIASSGPLLGFVHRRSCVTLLRKLKDLVDEPGGLSFNLVFRGETI